MASKAAFQHWSYEEFARLPEGDGNRYEVIAGELVVTPSSPGMAHQELVGRLYLLLRPFVDANKLGRVVLSPIDVLFAEGDYLVPDMVFVRAGRPGLVTKRGIEGAPDLVVEVLSGSTAFRDRGIKRERYARYGVAQYWVVDPRKLQIEVYRPEGGTANVMTSGMLEWQPVPDYPTLTIDVAELFRDLD